MGGGLLVDFWCGVQAEMASRWAMSAASSAVWVVRRCCSIQLLAAVTDALALFGVEVRRGGAERRQRRREAAGAPAPWTRRGS